MENVTVVIPTSCIPSHPSTKILDEALASVMRHLPRAPIIITCDGLRDGWEIARTAYIEYIECIPDTFTVKVFERHVHQSGMMRAILPLIETPLVLYLEHDWTLGFPIDWDTIEQLIVSGVANYVKFAPGDRIHPLHEHMMLDRILWKGVPFIKTVQYSANPHVASTEWYRKLSLKFFTGQTDYIENLLHGPLATAFWGDYQLMIYNPIEGGMKRAFHLDGANTV